ncbi:flagella basal body P-ring formation protein FlgA [Sphingomonas oligoaromativorans]|uniref:flagella basal body P-ring formation protein FlgA n=1 Tax=Sphingomonas oligoaromativorans TaxID=575322 RepID=UPI00142095D7|nr:flagella basal body P-ring formation protein FlgA [Sphingomonas oligoaromativorans]NIJ31975.1 flagella basal body P-ring formation protein FlgA [Sphingomonas oligoaromativorans]
MARKALAFFLLLGASAAAHAATDASGFEDLDKLEGRLVGALDVEVGKPGGPLTHLDRRLKLKPCPVPATIDPPALGAVALRCEPLGWRIRVPLMKAPGQTATAAGGAVMPVAARAMPALGPAVIKRGDPVELAATDNGFTVTTEAVAQEDGRVGGRIRVKPVDKGAIVVGEVVDTGRVRVTSF